MQARMKNPAMIIPGAMEALQVWQKLPSRGRAEEDARSCSPAGKPDQRLQRMRRHEFSL
jgi:hypothetical protein